MKICLHTVPYLQVLEKQHYNKEGRFRHQRDLGSNPSSALDSLCGLCNLGQVTYLSLSFLISKMRVITLLSESWKGEMVECVWRNCLAHDKYLGNRIYCCLCLYKIPISLNQYTSDWLLRSHNSSLFHGVGSQSRYLTLGEPSSVFNRL